MKVSLFSLLILMSVAFCRKQEPPGIVDQIDSLAPQVGEPGITLAPVVVREIASRSAKALRILPRDTVFGIRGVSTFAETIDQHTAPWYQIQTSDGTGGFVFAGYTAPPPVSAFTLVAPVPFPDGLPAIVLDLAGTRTAIVPSPLKGETSSSAVISLDRPGWFFEGAVYKMVRPDAVYLAYGLSIGEASSSYIIRIDPRTRRIVWTADMQAFNMTCPFAQSDSLLVAAIGTIGKVDLATGKFIWRHADLYKDGNFNSFSHVFALGQTAYFIEEVKQSHLGPRLRIDAAATTGEILFRGPFVSRPEQTNH